MRWRSAGFFLLLAIGCQPVPGIPTPGNPELHGRVELPRSGWQVKVAASDLASKATINLLPVGGGGPVATGLTDADGAFKLNANPAALSAGDAFYLDASNRPASNLPRLRLRTIVKWDGTRWISLTGQPDHVINAHTTALALLASYTGVAPATIARDDGDGTGALDKDGNGDYTVMDPAAPPDPGAFDGTLAADMADQATALMASDYDPLGDFVYVTKAEVQAGSDVGATAGFSRVQVEGYGLPSTGTTELEVTTDGGTYAATATADPLVVNPPLVFHAVLPRLVLDQTTGGASVKVRALMPNGARSNALDLSVSSRILMGDAATQVRTYPNALPDPPMALTVQPDGTAHVLWVDDRQMGNQHSIWHRTWHRHGGLGPATMVSQIENGAPGEAHFFSLRGEPVPRLVNGTVAGTPQVHAFWLQQIDQNQTGGSLPLQDALMHRVWQGGTWSKTNHVSDHPDGTLSTVTAVAATMSGDRPAVVYARTAGLMDVFYRRWDGATRPNGAADWSGVAEVNVSSNIGTARSFNPAIACAPNGTTHFAWERPYTDQSEKTELCYRRMDASGMLEPTAYVLTSAGSIGANRIRNIQIAAKDDGSVLVVWEDVNTSQLGSAFIPAGGSPASPVVAFVPNSKSGDTGETSPSLVSGDGQNFYLVSQLNNDNYPLTTVHDVGYEIFWRRFDATTGTWDANPRNLSESFGETSEGPVLAWNGDLHVAWLEGRMPTYMPLHLPIP